MESDNKSKVKSFGGKYLGSFVQILPIKRQALFFSYYQTLFKSAEIFFALATLHTQITLKESLHFHQFPGPFQKRNILL